MKNNIDDLRTNLNAMPAAPKLQAEVVPGARAPLSGPLPEFAKVRENAVNQAGVNTSGQVDSLRRRFAALGGLNSGAAIQAQGQVEEQGAQRKEAAGAQVDFQEAQERQRRNEAMEARDIATSEASRGRNFARETANADMDFKDRVFRFDSGSKLAQLDLMWEQFLEDRENTEFNKRLALEQQRNSGGLLGAGGFLGTGIGA